MSFERTRMREPEPADPAPYDLSMREREAYLERQRTGKVVVRAADRRWRQSRQGRAMYYLHNEAFKDTALIDWKVFVHDIKTHSGKHVHQGGIIIYVLEGSGYSVINGQREEWKAGDVLLLPLEPGGLEHQHFNDDPARGCKWIAFIYKPFQDLLGSELVQREVSPDFVG